MRRYCLGVRAFSILAIGNFFTACSGGHSVTPPFTTTGAVNGGRTESLTLSDPTKPYKLLIAGTFGGANSFVTTEISPDTVLSENGILSGCAQTAIANPNYPVSNPAIPADPFIEHAFDLKNGVLTDLGTLPGGKNSCNSFISGNGLVTGASENGATDLAGLPEAHAVLWKDGRIDDLGTLGGSDSFSSSVNDSGEVTGGAANTIPDAYFGVGQQIRAYLWHNGVMQDLGTLGGADAFGIMINNRGQILGASFTNAIANVTTGAPTSAGFFWDHGTMTAIPDPFGGTAVSPFFLNNHGQAVGAADPAGDPTNPDGSLQGRPFLWSHGVFTDLGTFGGSDGYPTWVNDVGQIVGQASLPGTAFHAFLWQTGTKSDLGTLPGETCSQAYSINARGQVVGFSAACDFSSVRAFLWQKSTGMIDLNAFLPQGSGLTLFAATNINDRGEIAGDAFDTTGNEHAFVLVPTGVSISQSAAGAHASSPQKLSAKERAFVRSQLMHRRFGILRPHAK